MRAGMRGLKTRFFRLRAMRASFYVDSRIPS